MRDKEETFVLSPSQIFQQDIVDRRMDFLVEKMVSLEERIDKISKTLTEILGKLEPPCEEGVLEVRTQKVYGFEPKDEVD